MRGFRKSESLWIAAAKTYRSEAPAMGQEDDRELTKA
jgi:hypothetical protein